MSKKILVTLSEYGYWGEELIGPLDVMNEHGYEYTFVTARGRKPPALAAEHGSRVLRSAAA